MKSTFLKLIFDYVVKKKKVFTAEDCKNLLEANHTANQPNGPSGAVTRYDTVIYKGKWGETALS